MLALTSIVAKSWPSLKKRATFSCAIRAVGFGARLTVPPNSSPSIEHLVAFPTDLLPKRYGPDENGQRVLIGLSIEETFEFETLDDLSPLDENGTSIAWRDGVPITDREKRWLELYQKHQDAWREMLAARIAQPKPR